MYHHLFRSEPKQQAPATLEERTAAATARADAALSIFRLAAEDLREAAAEQQLVVNAAEAEIERLTLISVNADDAADEYRYQADKLEQVLFL